MIDLAKRYAAAVASWVLAGRPVRSAVEVRRIFTEHCEPCENRDGRKCGICGCRVSADGPPLANKIAMADKACPDDPAQWVAESLPDGRASSVMGNSGCCG